MPDAGVAYQTRASRAIQRMVEFAPSSGGLALWIKHVDLPGGVEGPPAATDGNAIFYSESFAALTLAEQAGVVAHEVLHIALRHPQRFLDLQRLTGDVDIQLFNVCADAIVNSSLGHLGWLQLPANSVTLERLLEDALGQREGAESALLNWDVERLYRAIDDRRPKSGSGRQKQSAASAQSDPDDRKSGDNASNRQGQGGSAADVDAGQMQAGAGEDGKRSAEVRRLGADGHVDLMPGAGGIDAPEDEADQAREWSERLLRGHTNDGAFSMLRSLGADVPRTRTPWEQILRTQLARGLSMKPALSWSRPTRSYIANQGRGSHNRRLPWEPGFSSTATAPRLAVIIDVSGSIQNDLMERFAREIESISRRQECGLMLVVGDDCVRRVEVFKPGRVDLSRIDFHGGGGTDFTPLLQEADKFRPDIGVVLTDLDGPAYFQPRWQVIWVVPQSHANAIQPFGRKVALHS